QPRDAAIETEYALTPVDEWPIRALSVYCFVYRVADAAVRDDIVARLSADPRIESAQRLNRFETSTDAAGGYDDTYASLQHGLALMGVTAAHRQSRGRGVRVAIVDGHIDVRHEELEGRIARLDVFTEAGREPDHAHGTAVASVIGARSNNARGIVGVAPEADIELLVACWSERAGRSAVCDSFTLAKALDRVLRRPPHVLNLSLTGPEDALLSRLLRRAGEAGVIIVAAAEPAAAGTASFPSSLNGVLPVRPASSHDAADDGQTLFAPGRQIMVAVPNNAYDFRSGSSLATAHVSGVIALLLARNPELSFEAVRTLLTDSQRQTAAAVSVNACVALNLVDGETICRL
ncbi:MAG: S8 family serine peptidase, partial [Pseudomonadota bacterium]